MLSILDNLDTVNYIIQDSVSAALKKPLHYRNGLVLGDGYNLDFIAGTAKVGDCFRLRTNGMQNLCKIFMLKDKFHMRYSDKFILTYKVSTGTMTCNLFDDPFSEQDMEAIFFMQSTIGFGLPLTVDFSYDTMIETVNICRSLHNVFLSFREALKA